jgi:hypothetical protein
MGGMNLGPSPVGMGNAMGGMGGMGIGGGQNNHLGGLGQMGGLGRSDNMGGMTMDNTGLLANPVLSGYAPGLQGGYQGGYQGGFQGGFQGGLPMGMGKCVCMHDVASSNSLVLSIRYWYWY